MANVTFDIKGFEEVAKKLKQWPDKLKRRRINSIMRQAAKPMLEGVKRAAPIEKHSRTITRKGESYDPGNLAESIKIITGKKGKSKVNPTIYIGPALGLRSDYDGYYGFFVVSGIAGTIKTAPNDFITKGAKPHVAEVQNQIEAGMTRMLKREAKKLGFTVK
jgi:hypothetical protein